VTLLETLLGLLISHSHSQPSTSNASPSTSSPPLSQILTNLSNNLFNESKSDSGTTQDVWDGYREHWTKEEACGVLEQTAFGFTGFVKREEEPDAGAAVTGTGLSSGFKPLLPLKITDTADGGMSVVKNAKPLTVTTTPKCHHPPQAQPPVVPDSRACPSPSPPSPQSLYFHPSSSTSRIIPAESFERTTIASSISPTVAVDPHSSNQFQHNVNLIPTYNHATLPSFNRPGGDGWATSTHTLDPEHSSFFGELLIWRG